MEQLRLLAHSEKLKHQPKYEKMIRPGKVAKLYDLSICSSMSLMSICSLITLRCLPCPLLSPASCPSLPCLPHNPFTLSKSQNIAETKCQFKMYLILKLLQETPPFEYFCPENKYSPLPCPLLQTPPNIIPCVKVDAWMGNQFLEHKQPL